MTTVVVEKVISLKEGQIGEFRLEPEPRHPCRVVIELKPDASDDWQVMSGADVSGATVRPPNDVGGFHRTGHSYGRLSLRADDEDASGALRFIIICPDMELNVADYTIIERIGPNPMLKRRKIWNWNVFWGKVLAGSVASATAGALLNWWTAAAILACVLTGLLGGATGSAGGHLMTHLFDAPRRWTFRSAFLFMLFFTLAFSMFFGILAAELEAAAAAQGDIYNRVTFSVSVISAFLAAILPGILDNLQYDSQ